MYRCRTQGSPYPDEITISKVIGENKTKQNKTKIDKQAQQMLTAKGVVEGSYSFPYCVDARHAQPLEGNRCMERHETIPMAQAGHPYHCNLLLQSSLLSRTVVPVVAVPMVNIKHKVSRCKPHNLLSFTQHTWQVQLRAF